MFQGGLSWSPDRAMPPVTLPMHPVCLLQEKMLDIYWLLRVCLRTIEHGDRTGPLFAFMPEFYLSVAINSYSALKNYFGPVHSMEELPGDRAIHAGRGQKGAFGVSPKRPVLSAHGPAAHVHVGRREAASALLCL